MRRRRVGAEGQTVVMFEMGPGCPPGAPVRRASVCTIVWCRDDSQIWRAEVTLQCAICA